VLNWARQFNTFCFLDNHQYQFDPHSQECLLAVGIRDKPGINASFRDLQKYIDKKKKTWLFGHLNYDLKHNPARGASRHPDNIAFPEFFFFEPLQLIKLNKIELIIESDNPGQIFDEINWIGLNDALKETAQDVIIKNRIQKEEYVAVINKLKDHILRGDCYEINYCQEFFASPVVADALQVYKKLSQISPNPFSALYRLGDKWLICASPERFLKKEGQKIISQPIKGTSKRVHENAVVDEKNKLGLYHSKKDRSENVMIVDLVRNDLSKVCKEGSVHVEELFGIRSFPQVHHMISTVCGTLQENISFCDIISATFPMGSMTGAPKKRVMELIDQYEQTKRGIFSGAVGYISPNGDFDFNVVIRSILYNTQSGYLSFLTGSAITFQSDPEKEWEECLLKAEAMKNVFAG
jgi:para-aminobenzoate synthetase component 1